MTENIKPVHRYLTVQVEELKTELAYLDAGRMRITLDDKDISDVRRTVIKSSIEGLERTIAKMDAYLG